MPRFLRPGELITLLALPLPMSERWLPISDTTADPGLFGPGSTTWAVLREPLLILGGARALLMQAAHPLVAQGAIDHSSYQSDPFGRLVRTSDWAAQMSFGTRAEAERAAGHVNRLHQHVKGRLPGSHSTRRTQPGQQYSALDADLLLWVHATFVDTILVTHDRLIGTLTERDRDRFVKEWEVVAEMMGVPPGLLWPDHRAMRDYIQGEVDRGPIRPGEGSRQVMRTVTHPPLPSPLLRPVFDALIFSSLGFLPPKLRMDYGITWTARHEATLRTFCRVARGMHATMPRRLRVGPIHDFALARTEGRLKPRRAA